MAIRSCKPAGAALSPTAPCVQFAFDVAGPLDDPGQPLERIAFTVAFNMSDQPAISPDACYPATGLPIGMQNAGRRFDALGVLRIARARESLRQPSATAPAQPRVHGRLRARGASHVRRVAPCASSVGKSTARSDAARPITRKTRMPPTD